MSLTNQKTLLVCKSRPYVLVVKTAVLIYDVFCVCLWSRNVRDHRILAGLQRQTAAVEVFDGVFSQADALCPITRRR